MIVLDASALLASILREPGWEVVDEVLDDAAISAVNYAEVAGRCIDLGLETETALKQIGGLDVRVFEFDRQQAEAATRLRPSTRHLGLSLADRACLALGLHLGSRIMTADRIWGQLDVGAEIQLIR